MRSWEIEMHKATHEIDRLLKLSISNFVEFTNCFHNCVYMLKGIWDISPNDVRSKLQSDFYPMAIKMLRELKMHDGDDFFELQESGFPGVIARGGPLILNNAGTLILHGQEMPKGVISVCKEFVTANGKPIEFELPVIRLYKFRSLNLDDPNEKKYAAIQTNFLKHDPFSFMSACKEHYQASVFAG